MPRENATMNPLSAPEKPETPGDFDSDKFIAGKAEIKKADLEETKSTGQENLIRNQEGEKIIERDKNIEMAINFRKEKEKINNLFLESKRRAQEIENHEAQNANFEIIIEKNEKSESLLMRNKDGEIIDLKKWLPKNCKFDECDQFIYLPSKRIVGYEKMSNQSAFLLSLFHELGHAHHHDETIKPGELKTILASFQVIFDGLKKIDRDRKIVGLKPAATYVAQKINRDRDDSVMPSWYIDEKQQLISKSERSAWAYALKNLRELKRYGVDVFSGFLNNEEMIFYINHCLLSYEVSRLNEYVYPFSSFNSQHFRRMDNYKPIYAKNALKKKINSDKQKSELSEDFNMDKFIDELWLKDENTKEAILGEKLANKQLTPADLQELYDKSNDYTVGIAILKNLPNIQRLPEDKQVVVGQLLKHYLSEEYQDELYFDKISETENFIKKCPEKLRDFIIKHHAYPPGEEFYEVLGNIYYDDFIKMKTMAVTQLAELGNEAEQFLIDRLETEIETKGLKENIFVPPIGEKLYKDTGWEWFNRKNDPTTDQRGNLIAEGEKKSLNEEYVLYKNYFSSLAKIGTIKSIDFAANFLINKRFSTLYLENYLEEIFKINKQYSADKIIQNICEQRLADQQSYRLMMVLTDLIGVEQIRLEINGLIEQNRLSGNENVVDNLEYARSLITPNHDKIAIENLQKFYAEKIKFEDYGINQKMNGKEVELLKSLIGKDDPRSGGASKVLEEGCGTGRLLLELKQAGYDITGFDFTKRHIDLIKEKDAEAKVFQGDWHNNAIKDESFDTVYSLGRNILHDYSIVDQTQLFREAARILKSGGKFIFDIPDRNKGGYKQMVDEYGREMKSRGIKNFREGAIYDSPDGVNFTTRYAYSDEDIKMLAQLAGFKIKETRREKLATGKGDENIYYVLEKNIK